MSAATTPVDVRLARKLKRNGECLLWTGATARGYGIISLAGRMVKTHRLAYELAHGPIPPGEGPHGTVVMHSCDRPLCCNPAHLSLGTQRDNMLDAAAKGHRHRGGRNPGKKAA
jgi:hypothetical protein